MDLTLEDLTAVQVLDAMYQRCVEERSANGIRPPEQAELATNLFITVLAVQLTDWCQQNSDVTTSSPSDSPSQLPEGHPGV